jgi:hypothetical protein
VSGSSSLWQSWHPGPSHRLQGSFEPISIGADRGACCVQGEPRSRALRRTGVCPARRAALPAESRISGERISVFGLGAPGRWHRTALLRMVRVFAGSSPRQEGSDKAVGPTRQGLKPEFFCGGYGTRSTRRLRRLVQGRAKIVPQFKTEFFHELRSRAPLRARA